MRDPGNLGTILRTADAVAAAGIILIDDCTDPHSIEAVRASMGAVFNRVFSAGYSCRIFQLLPNLAGSVIGTACQLQSIIGRQTGLLRCYY